MAQVSQEACRATAEECNRPEVAWPLMDSDASVRCGKKPSGFEVAWPLMDCYVPVDIAQAASK